MGIRNTLSLSKGEKQYLCRIDDYKEEDEKIKLQIFGGDSVRYCSIHQYDMIKLEVPMHGNICEMECKVLYIDKVEHKLIIEKPQKAVKINRRKNKRVEIHMDMKITSGTKEIKENECLMGNKKTNAVAFDVSIGGIGIFSSHKFKEGDELIFNFSLPDGKVLNDVIGEVKSIRKSDFEFILKYGISFKSLNAEQNEYLKDFLDHYIDGSEDNIQ